jgi:hypothetical protein
LRRTNKAFFIAVCIIIVLGLLGGLTWANYRFSSALKGGDDFLSYWLGTRLFLTEGQSAYSEQTTSQIQIMAYGHQAKENEKSLIFTNPLYSLIIYAPFALIPDFNLARSIWMTVLEIAIGGIIFFSIKISDWKSGLAGLLFYSLFSFLWYYSASALISGDVIIITSLFVVMGIWAVKKGEWEYAGVVFALSTIKPQYAIILIIILLVWSFSIRQYKFAIWFFSSLTFFIIGTVLLQSDWMIQNLRASLQNLATLSVYNPATVFSALLPGVGTKIGWSLSGVILALIIIEWARVRKPDERKLAWLICLTLVGVIFLGLPVETNSFVMLLPLLPMIFTIIDERWRKAGVVLNGVFYIILLAGIWLIYFSTKGNVNQTAILFFPAISVLFLLMYWIRNWVMNAVKPWYDIDQEEQKRFR